jgi:hypothetical protein
MAVQVKASFKLTGWNANQLKLRVPQILTEYGKVLGNQLKEEIQTQQFAWPRSTKRRNGQTVSSPRDIVDLGGLLRSQRRDRPSATQLRFMWEPKSSNGFMYAGLILTGYTTSKGTVVPGRNWIKPALDKQPLERFFAEQWRRLDSIGGL